MRRSKALAPQSSSTAVNMVLNSIDRVIRGKDKMAYTLRQEKRNVVDWKQNHPGT